MKKLIYTIGTMNSSKTMNLIATLYNYKELNQSVVILAPLVDDRANGKIKSRAIADEYECVRIAKEDNLEWLFEKNVDVVIVDEIQFFTKKQIDTLWRISQNTTVMCYGLRTDFKGELFEGSKRLLELCDEIREVHTLCHVCKSHKAKFNSRWVNGNPVLEGEQIMIGDLEYKPVCKACYEKILKQKL